jgi:hypothetical protein
MMAEVNAVADMEDIAATLPPPHDEELKRAIYQYLNAVLDRELPLMAQGRVSPTTTAALTELWVPLAQFHAVSDADVSLREIAMNKVMDVGEQRRQRIVFSRERIPGLLWWILVGSGAVIVAGACVVSLNYHRPTSIFLSALTVLVALVLFSIHVLERPFQYGLSPESNEYQAVWQAIGGSQTVGTARPGSPNR